MAKDILLSFHAVIHATANKGKDHDEDFKNSFKLVLPASGEKTFSWLKCDFMIEVKMIMSA